MIIRKKLFLPLVLIGGMFSFSWGLTGTLKDNNNNPLAGAEVYLVNANIKDSTDAAGTFSFLKLPARKIINGVKELFTNPVLSGGRMAFSLSQKSVIEYGVYTIKGTCVLQYKGMLEAGDHQLPLTKNGSVLARGMYVINIKSEKMALTFKYNSVCNNRFYWSGSSNETGSAVNAVAITASAATLPEFVDTLIITKVSGEVTCTRKIRVSDYTDNINSTKYTTNGLQIVILDPSNDNDADGLTNFEERYVYFTNSELFDTDGDGLGDNAEIKDNTNPRIADYPHVSFRPTGYPLIMASFSKNVQNDTGMEISSGGDYNHSSGYSSQQEVNANVSVAVMGGFEAGSDPKFTGSITATAGTGCSFSWGQEHSEAMSRNWNSARTITKSEGASIDGGEVILEVELTNNSSVNLTLVDPMIRLTSTDNGLNTLGTLIGELTVFTGDGLSNNNEVYIPFEAGSNKATRKFRVEISNPDVLEQIAKFSYGFKAQLTNIKFKTSLGEVDTLMANIYRRTADVTVDFGQALSVPNNFIRKRVASRAVYNDFYTNLTDRFISTSFLDLLKTAGVNPVIGTEGEMIGITEINGVKNGALKNGNWSIVSQITTDSLQVFSTSLSSYDPANIRAGQSTVISCIYDADVDDDGVPGRVEAVIGTDDTKVDSDGDSLSDKQEFVGWHRSSDPANVSWKTNPLRKDTDADSIDDPIDPDPLTSVVNPLDSCVSFISIALSSLQGTAWLDTVNIRDTVSTIATGSLMRGPATIAMKFTNPVFSVTVLCKNSSDTVRLTTPDTAGYYKTNLNLVPGNNEVLVTAISRNGYLTKKVQITGIQRRLARIDQADATLFTVSLPSSNLYGIAADVCVDVDKVKLMDPLIQRVVVLRTDIFGCPVVDSDKSKKMIAEELGDAGNGDKVIAVGGTMDGKVDNHNTYKIVRILESGKSPITDADTSVKQINDFAYFAYTVTAADNNCYYTAPLSGQGSYLQNSRTIVIDSIGLVSICTGLWGGSAQWNVVNQAVVHIGNDSVAACREFFWTGLQTGIHQTTYVKVGRELGSNNELSFGNYPYNGVLEANYRRLDGVIGFGGGWKDNAHVPGPLSLNTIVAPEKNPTLTNYVIVDGDMFTPVQKTWTNVSSEYNSPHITAYRTPVNYPSAIHIFDNDVMILWHWKNQH